MPKVERTAPSSPHYIVPHYHSESDLSTIDKPEYVQLITSIQRTNLGVEAAINSMKTQYDGIQEKIDSLESESGELRKSMAELEGQLEERVHVSRSSKCEMRNVIESENDTEWALMRMIEKLGNTLGMAIKRSRHT
ncbi:unnamed protein product [Euphydryas editha]|uniref:Uncharacterized protein n=1 Tax=Euphydryas editha TaxID=104508 RepID=A0AAU9V270_EUPED|nr:unnamed protein product [Euphydryas editha]